MAELSAFCACGIFNLLLNFQLMPAGVPVWLAILHDMLICHTNSNKHNYFNLVYVIIIIDS